MITIKIYNTQEIAIREKGWFIITIAKLFCVNIEKKVQEKIVKEIVSSLKENGVDASVELK